MDQAGGVQYTRSVFTPPAMHRQRARGVSLLRSSSRLDRGAPHQQDLKTGAVIFFAFFLHLRICSTATRERGRERERERERRRDLKSAVEWQAASAGADEGWARASVTREERRGRPTPVEVIDLATTVCVRCLTDVRWAHGEETCEYPPQNGRAQG